MKLTLKKLINKDFKNALNKAIKALFIFVSEAFHGNIFFSTSDFLYGNNILSDNNPKECQT